MSESKKKKGKPAPADKAETPATAAAEEKPLSELEKLTAERDELLDRYQRAAADYQNLRKRFEKDVRTRSEDRNLELIMEILLVLDHFELALKAPSGDKGFVEGIQMIKFSLESILQRQGIQPIKTEGVAFDPKVHEAVAREVQEGTKPDTILEEVRKGYVWRDRVIRPSQVKVAVEEEESAAETTEETEE